MFLTIFSAGLIDKNHVDTLERAERAVKGYRVPGTNQILSLFEAMRKGLVVESRGIRLLEAQIATGGLIDPKAHHRVRKFNIKQNSSLYITIVYYPLLEVSVCKAF